MALQRVIMKADVVMGKAGMGNIITGRRRKGRKGTRRQGEQGGFGCGI